MGMLVVRLATGFVFPLQLFRPLVLSFATLERMIFDEQAEYLVQGVRRVFEPGTDCLFCMGCSYIGAGNETCSN